MIEEETPIRYCPDCGYNLAANVHAIMHELWQKGEPIQEEPETMTVEVVYQGKRYKGIIPCIGLEEEERSSPVSEA